MRNIFDQYRHHENRLTHALVTCLCESRPLLESFAALVDHAIPKNASINFSEQHRPGETQELPEDEAERRGLPDAWIDDGEDWALVIESKVQHKISLDQLKAHRRSAREYRNAQIILISIEDAPALVKASFRCIQWTDVYEWAVSEARRQPWADRLAKYMEAAERKLINEEKGLNGALTTFAGVDFGFDKPYSYMEAKRLLRLLMGLVRSREDLANKLGVNLQREGRPAITGSGGSAVWDMLPLGSTDEHFTRRPHLTVGIRDQEVIAQLTIPNNVPNPIRKQLMGETADEFMNILERFIKDIAPVLMSDPSCKPYVEVIQRHWPHRRATAIADALLTFDPQTVRGSGPVKKQPEWATLAFETMHGKNANLQIAIGVKFPYGESTLVTSKSLGGAIVDVFLATGPILVRAEGTVPGRST